ncbi:hypothetical protein DPMN_143493 [Dreissena polymorpha]|uniref:Uncharacterized protein n=1 Tax=Dreissena polymorpha TaxID=45954 RepID=A0A9D4GD59_DREPO|nr:hypothetical protein DPMN_143493 [Dreissena polymorpha]
MIPDHESSFILKADVEVAMRSLKAGKSPNLDNNPSELILIEERQRLQQERHYTIRSERRRSYPKEWTQPLVIPLP